MATFDLYCEVLKDEDFYLIKDGEEYLYADIKIDLENDKSVCGCDDFFLEENTWENILDAIRDKKVEIKESNDRELFLSVLTKCIAKEDGFDLDLELEAVNDNAPDWGNI